MSDALGSAMSGLSDFGGNILSGNLGGVGADLGKFAGTVAGLPGQAASGIEGLFGGGAPTPTQVTGEGMPAVNLGAGAANGTPGAVGASAASAMPGAAAISSADPSALNAPPPIDASLAGMPNAGTGAAGVVAPQAPDALQQALSSVAQGDPMAARIAAGAPAASSGDPMMDRLGAAGALSADKAPPNAMQSLIHSLTSPQALKMGAPLALTGIEAINALKPSPIEKTLKSELAHAQGQQSLMERQLAAEQSGQLPQALQAGLDLKAQQAEAAVRQRYAQAGMSGSTAEAADIAAARTEAQLQAFQEAQAMVGQTAQLLGGYDNEVSTYLTNLFNVESAKDKALRDAVVGLMQAAGTAPPPK